MSLPSSRVCALLLCTLVFAATPASASTILTYAGLNFNDITPSTTTTPPDVYTTSDSVTLSLELSAPLGVNLANALVTPLSFSASDGLHTITNITATSSGFQFTTNGTGNIVGWIINLGVRAASAPFLDVNIVSRLDAPNSAIFDLGQETLCGPGSTTTTCNLFGDPFYFQRGLIRDAPGTWNYQTTAADVPEPATLWLVGTAFAAGAWRMRRVRRRPVPGV